MLTLSAGHGFCARFSPLHVAARGQRSHPRSLMMYTSGHEWKGLVSAAFRRNSDPICTMGCHVALQVCSLDSLHRQTIQVSPINGLEWKGDAMAGSATRISWLHCHCSSNLLLPNMNSTVFTDASTIAAHGPYRLWLQLSGCHAHVASAANAATTHFWLVEAF